MINVKKYIFLILAALVAISSCQNGDAVFPDEFDGLPKPGEILAEFSAEPAFLGTYRPGEALRTKINADIKPGWKVYPLAFQHETAPPPIQIKFPTTKLLPVKAPYETIAVAEFVDVLEMDIATHKKRAFFYQNFSVPNDHNLGEFRFSATIQYVACSYKVCMPPANQTVEFSYAVSDGAVRAEFAEQDFTIEDVNTSKSDDYKSNGLWAFLLLSLLMGLISLTTPCVFPMIPITVSYFIKKSADNRSTLLKHATLFSLGIVVSYTVIGLLFSMVFGADSVVALAANPVVNIALGVIFIVFSLSLIGLLNIQISPALINPIERYTRKSGTYTGGIVMGVVFTLTAFTCTVQFIGVLMVASYQGDILWPFLGMLVFSTVFALPFFLLAIMPGVMTKFRNVSPAHLGNVKIVLGILELGVAVKFFSNADLVWGTNLISRDVNLVVWALLASVCAIFLIVNELRRKKLYAFTGYKIAIVFFAVLSGYFLYGTNDQSVGELADSLLPPPKNSVLKKGGDYVTEREFSQLTWHPSLAPALKEAIALNRPVFVDFTGYTCINCRWMEQNVFTQQDVFDAFKHRYVLAKLYTDGGDFAEENRTLQISKFKTVSLPFYAILDKHGTILKTNSGIMEVSEFIKFLQGEFNR